MLNFISSRWQALKTKYKKFIPFVLSFVFIFCNPLTSFAYNSDSFQFGNAWTFRTTSPNYTLQWQPIRNGSPIGTYTVSFDTGAKSYPLNNSAETNLSSLLFGSSATRFDFEFLQDLYDYYLIFNLYSFDVSSSFNFPLQQIRFGYYDSANTFVSTSDFSVVASGDRNDNGYTVICKIPDMPSAALNFFYLVGNFDIPSNLVVEGLFLSFDKDTDIQYINSVISAINNQTDYIVNGNDSTGGIVSQFQSNLNEFNSVINQFDDIENGFISDFTSSNDEIKSILSDYQFTGNLLSCANWVTDKYMDFFDNSGDFKQYFIYPLIIGIVLFFIGRGQVILGQAYRKPYESTTVTSSDSSGYTRNKDGSWSPTGYKGSTTTTTYRSGGKLRK